MACLVNVLFFCLPQDTKGPEIRTGFLEDGGPIHLVRGQDLELTTDYEFKGNSQKIACSYNNLPGSVKVGSVRSAQLLRLCCGCSCCSLLMLCTSHPCLSLFSPFWLPMGPLCLP
jgi:hypothetical protein